MKIFKKIIKGLNYKFFYYSPHSYNIIGRKYVTIDKKVRQNNNIYKEYYTTSKKKIYDIPNIENKQILSPLHMF